MTERGGWRAGVLAAAGVAAVALVVWVVTRPPVRLLRAPDSGPQALPVPPSTTAGTPGSPTPTHTAPPTPPPALHPWIGTVLAVAFALIFAAALTIGAVLAVRSVRARRRRRLPGVGRGEAAPDLPSSVSAALAARRTQQQAALREGEARNAIVACWLQLEEAVQATGLRPRPSETAAELTSRVLGQLDVDPASVRALASLYREARFSQHSMGEADRDAAVAALLRLHADLPVPVEPTLHSREVR